MMSISPRVRFMPLAAAGALLLTSTAFADQPVEFVYDGKVIVEGHFEKPHDKVTRISRQRYLYDGKDRLRLEWTTWVQGDSTSSTETTLLLGDRVLVQGHGRVTWIEPKGDEKNEARFQALMAFPALLIAESNKGKKICGREWNLIIDDAGVLTTAIANFSHPRLGDSSDSLLYGARSADLAGSPPRVLKMNYTQRHDQIWLQTKVNTSTIPDEKVLNPSSPRRRTRSSSRPIRCARPAPPRSRRSPRRSGRSTATTSIRARSSRR